MPGRFDRSKIDNAQKFRPADRGGKVEKIAVGWPGGTARKNVDIIRNLCTSPNFVGDLMDLATPNCEWSEQGGAGKLPYAGKIYKGPEGILDFFMTVGPLFKTLSLNTHTYYGYGDQVLTMVTIQAASNDGRKNLTSEVAREYWLKDGKVQKAVAYVDTAGFADLIGTI